MRFDAGAVHTAKQTMVQQKNLASAVSQHASQHLQDQRAEDQPPEQMMMRGSVKYQKPELT